MFYFIRPIRPVDRVFIHCSASDYDEHDDIRVIRKWHVKERGWTDVGYHYFIQRDGTVQEGRDPELTPAAQRNHNKSTLAICVHGKDRFEKAQLEALADLCHEIDNQYGYITFHGHCEVDKGKTCPNFNYVELLNLNDKGQMV